MSDRPTHGWCASCKEDSAITAAGNCLWCGGPTEPSRPKRGGWKRPELQGSRYSEIQLRALHLAHQRGASINSLGKQTYAKVGYKGHHGAAVAISREWKRMGLKARDRVEATVMASTKHGLAPKHGPRPGYGTYKRRVLQGQEDRPDCKGLKTQPPGKGDPCDRPAMNDSEYCFSHDPDRREEIEAILVDARLKQPTMEMVPLAPFSAWLYRRRDELGSWSALAGRLGRNISLITSYAHGVGTAGKKPKTEIGCDTVRALLEADGTTTFDDVYAVEAVAA